MKNFEDIKGTWIHSLPWDSDDYLVEYVVSGNSESPSVSAKDLNDGEIFRISDIKWNNGILEFKSFMPSTKRQGINKFSLLNSEKIISQFTFTVLEELQRKNT